MNQKVKSVLNKVKRYVGYPVLALALVQGAAHLNYSRKNLENMVNPSEIRKEFRKNFNVYLLGDKENVEDEGMGVSKLSLVLDKEKKEKDFNLERIFMKSEKFFNKPIWDQYEGIVVDAPGGTAFGKYIELGNVSPESIHHEIKHTKTFEILKRNPEFKKRWEKISTDKNGNSMYLSGLENVFYWVKGMEKLIPQDKINFSNNLNEGFISAYSKNNFYEDVAELCSRVEEYPYYFLNIYYGDKTNQYKKVKEKISLAMEVGLIPREFLDYLNLRKLSRDLFAEGLRDKHMKEYFEESDKFLKKYQRSVYLDEIYNSRGFIKTYDFSDKEREKDAEKEFDKALKCDYKGEGYSLALYSLKTLNKDYSNNSYNLFEEAYKEYWKRFDNGDPDISRRGVNDFLISHGYDLK